MPSTQGEHRSERESLSPLEKAKQDRRIARAIQQGMPLNRLMRTFAVTEVRVTKVATALGLQIVKGKGGHTW